MEFECRIQEFTTISTDNYSEDDENYHPGVLPIKARAIFRTLSVFNLSMNLL
jgi:hypothetical protein